MTPAPAPEPGRTLFDGRARARPENTLVAVLEGRPAGLVAMVAPTPLASNRHVLEICLLAVEPAEQGHGIGRALVEAAIAEARARGARRLTLRVLETNSRARLLYEAAGFEVEGVLRDEFLLAGRYVDDLLMARDLTRD